MYYFISQNKDQNHFKIISKALNSRCLKNYKSPLIGSGGFWTTIRMKSSSGATYTRETRLIIGKLSEEHQSAKSQNIWQPWILMLKQKLNMFSTFFFKVIPLQAKRVGESIEIRPKKISPTRTLSTLGCLWLCNTVLLAIIFSCELPKLQ